MRILFYYLDLKEYNKLSNKKDTPAQLQTSTLPRTSQNNLT